MGKTIISDDRRFEWDDEKDERNVERRGISFSKILEIFDDPTFLTGYDTDHSETEDRYFGIGRLNDIVLIVFFTPRGERTRIFSARRVTPKEKELYDDYIKKIDG
ncbi:hypothetical protein PilKf_01829 [Pillotina sp. SPG140]|jgi:uncharacterized DUF497 family protein